MVIISTSATDVSIQAVSPELGVHFSSTLGLAVASQAGGGAAGGVASAAGAAAGAGACANDTSTTRTLTNAARRSPQARANSPAREDFLKAMVLLLSVELGRGL